MAFATDTDGLEIHEKLPEGVDPDEKWYGRAAVVNVC